MCSRARCSHCGKVTWRGCGRHVDTVMAGVPRSQRCDCPPTPRPSLFGLFRRR